MCRSFFPELMSNSPKSRFERLLRTVAASRFLTVSALVHLIIIVLLGGAVLVPRIIESNGPGTQAAYDPQVPDDTNAQQPPVTQPPVPEPQKSTNVPPAPPTGPNIDYRQIVDTKGGGNNLPPLPVAPFPPSPVGPMNPAPGGPANPGPPSKEPPAFPYRPHDGSPFISIHDGTLASEQAVQRALQWLQANQHTDGTWGSTGYHDGFTGLALLCFLGHGETPSSHTYGVVVSNAIDTLAKEGAANGGHYSSSGNFTGNPAAYDHAITTYALCEAYVMTKDQRLAPLIGSAVNFIADGQRADGGWAYRYDTGPNAQSDLSVSGWQIQALKAAHLTGIPGVDKVALPSLAKAMRKVDSLFNANDGSFGYVQAGDRNYTLTGVGALSKLLWTGRTDHQTRVALKNIVSKPLKYDGPDCNLYSWYYDTQACFQAQSGPWDWWKQPFQDQLTHNQSGDGSWPPTGGNEAGGFNSPAGDGPD